MYWTIIVITVCFLLLLFLLWKEVKRPNRIMLAARIVATIIAVVSLACIELPVSIRRQMQTKNNEVAIILTQGFNADSVQKVLMSTGSARIFTTDKSIKSFKARYIPDLSRLSEDSLKISSVHIFGFGLPQNELVHLKIRDVRFHPGQIKNRISSIAWNQNLKSGENLIVQGSYDNASATDAKIILNNFDTNLDSVILPSKQTSPFQLSAAPKHIDKAIYSISVISSGDTVETNPLPVEVKSPAPINILVLASSPDFENKFLKNWLAENDYGFAVRTSISKNKYDKQFVNFSQASLDRITVSLLEKFDVVIADVAALNAMPSSDLSNLRTYVEVRGGGLIVKSGSGQKSIAFHSSYFPVVEIRESALYTTKLNFGANHISSALKIEGPLYIRSVAGTQPLIKDQQMRIVTNSRMFGLGKVIVTTVPNSYAWWLAGDTDDYTAYWTLLLKKAAKQISVSHRWQLSSPMPHQHEEIHFRLHSLNAEIPQAQSGGETLYPQQNFFLPYEWNLTYWPIRQGWQALTYNNGPTTWWYTFDEEDWQGIKATEKTMATKKFAAMPDLNEVGGAIKEESNLLIPKYYFFFLFILASGFLWFEKKYRNG